MCFFDSAAKAKYNFSDDENSDHIFNSDNDDEQLKPIENFNHASEADEDSQGAAGLTDDDDDYGFGNAKRAAAVPKKTTSKPP